MKEILIGTSNPAKMEQIKGALRPIDITVNGLDKNLPLPEITEDGQTPQENSQKKALAYAKTIGKTILSMDNALYIDGLSPEDQPGIHVRRINGRTDRLTDQELLEYYSKIIDRLGGKANGHWEFALQRMMPKAISPRQTM